MIVKKQTLSATQLESNNRVQQNVFKFLLKSEIDIVLANNGKNVESTIKVCAFHLQTILMDLLSSSQV